jgi:enoyl-CoA hydratase/carnithine racemase
VQELYKRVSEDSDKFCLAVTKAMNEQCPVSLGVIYRLIHSAKNKTLKECFIQDYNLSQRFAVDPNFAEGVRTVLIDKGAAPNWSHKHILEVKPQDVDHYFNWPSTF